MADQSGQIIAQVVMCFVAIVNQPVEEGIVISRSLLDTNGVARNELGSVLRGTEVDDRRTQVGSDIDAIVFIFSELVLAAYIIRLRTLADANTHNCSANFGSSRNGDIGAPA